MRTFTVMGCGLAIGVIASQGCAIKAADPLHCAVNDGNDYCAAEFPDGSRPFCQRGTEECYTDGSELGCVADRPADACYSPCGGRASLDENGECIPEESSSGSSSGGVETEGSSGSESGSESSTTGPQPCVEDEECGFGSTPFCGPAGTCVACDEAEEPDAACAGVDPMLPLCVGEACVACTDGNPAACDDQLLLCDAATNSCVQCEAHGECESGACELATGRCFPDELVVHVDGDGGADYTSIVAAVGAIDEGGHGVIVVHELDGGASYQVAGGLVVDGGKTVALLAALGESPIVQGTGGNAGLRVSGAGSILYMEGLRVAGNTGGLGMVVEDAGFAWVDRSRIVQNSGGGVLAAGGAELTLRNCFVGDGSNGVNGLTVDGSTANVLYTSLGAGFDNFGDAFSVFCSGRVDVSIRNSLLVSLDNADGELSCSTAVVTNTASEALIAGVGNVALGDVAADWFVDINTGNFVLDNPPLMLSTTARWTTGDPPTDIHGDLRPTDDGADDYAGADRVP